jgi:predicted dehydrogenase/threonine dehydrogenase-like Zn-dependent dehydrogenase
MRQIEQNYRSGRLRVIETATPLAGRRTNLVASRVSLISAGTEKQIIDLARSSIAKKAMDRPDLVRKTLRKVRQEGLASTAGKVFAKLNTPIPLGYSLAGRVVEAGVDAGGYAAGDRIACAGAGVANHADYNAVPKHLSAPIPRGVSDEDASFVTLGAIALQGLRVTEPTLGERVVVMGLGLIGLLTVQLLRANGCRVLGFDPNPARATLAQSLGAEVAISSGLEDAVSSFSGGAGADAVIITASTKSSGPINTAAEISRTKGRVVIVGLVGMELDREPFYKRELDLRLSMSYGPGRYDPRYEDEGYDYPLPYVRWTEQRNMEAFLQLIAVGAVTPQALVTHRFPVERAEEAYSLLDSDEDYLAVLLTYPENPVEAKRVVPVAGRRAAAAADDIGISFIGFGNYAQTGLLPAFRSGRGTALRAVVTRGGVSSHHAAESAGFALAATDPDAALEDERTDLVCIATRHDSHADLAVRALEAGKHVFVEKPLALDESDLDRLEQAASAAQGTLTVGFNRRFAPMLNELAGRARGRGPLLMHYRINAGFIPAESWVHQSEGGGRIVGEGCHFVDALSALCGSEPVAVAAIRPQGIGDSVQAVLRFADGSTGTILYSSRGDPSVPKELIEIHGQGVVGRIEDFRELAITIDGKTERRTSRSQDKGQAAMAVRLLAAIRNAGEPPIPLKTLLAVSRATLAMAR